MFANVAWRSIGIVDACPVVVSERDGRVEKISVEKDSAASDTEFSDVFLRPNRREKAGNGRRAVPVGIPIPPGILDRAAFRADADDVLQNVGDLRTGVQQGSKLVEPELSILTGFP